MNAAAQDGICEQQQRMNDSCFFFTIDIGIIISVLVCFSSAFQLTEGYRLAFYSYIPTD
jgi:hypothetical protein